MALAVVAVLVAGGPPAAGQSLEEAVARDLSGFTPGFVVALHHNGSMQFLEAFNHEDVDAPPVRVDDVFAWPAGTDILLGTTIEALHRANDVLRASTGGAEFEASAADLELLRSLGYVD